MMNDHFPQMPPGGSGRLRALLANLKEDEGKLTENPLYKEGWDDGYQAAQENHRLLTQALSKVYNINE